MSDTNDEVLQEKRSSASSSGDENGKENEFVDVHRELQKDENRPASADLLVDLSVDEIMKQLGKTINEADKVVSSEADSTTSSEVLSTLIGKQEPAKPVEPVVVKPAEPVKPPSPAPTPSKPAAEEKPSVTIKKGHSLLEKLDAYPKVRDVLLWKCPKLSGGVFAASLVLLYCLATYSLLGLIGFLVLLTMTIVGSYRLYLTILGYVKGTKDDTFKKLNEINLSVPKERLNDIVNMVDSCGNKCLNKFKLLLLWDNVYASLAAYFVAYLVYSIGCTFNTITLLTIGLIDAFTLPKVYVMYKEPIDAVFKKVHVAVEDVVLKVKAKFPKLFPKKKTQ